MTLPGPRLRCAVPHCRRTIARSRIREEDEEWICGAHWTMTSLTWRRRYFALRRRYFRMVEQHGTQKGRQMVRVAWWMWARLRHQAIERAVGISG